MTLKKYLNLMSILTAICWLAWLVSLFWVNPEKAGIIGFVLFYFSLFMALWGSFSLVGFLLRIRFNPKSVVFVQIETAFRQAIWLSIIISVGLMLQGEKLLRWWNLLILIAFFLVLESFFFFSRKKYKRLG